MTAASGRRAKQLERSREVGRADVCHRGRDVDLAQHDVGQRQLLWCLDQADEQHPPSPGGQAERPGRRARRPRALDDDVRRGADEVAQLLRAWRRGRRTTVSVAPSCRATVEPTRVDVDDRDGARGDPSGRRG